MKKCINRFPIHFALAIVVCFFSLGANAASCNLGESAAVGAWINTGGDTEEVPRVLITEECRSDPGFGAQKVFSMQLWKYCFPQNCKSEKVEGVPYSNGWIYFKVGNDVVWTRALDGGGELLDLVLDAGYSQNRYRTWMIRNPNTLDLDIPTGTSTWGYLYQQLQGQIAILPTNPTAKVDYMVVAGALPEGVNISVSGSMAFISGSPWESGSFTATILAVDEDGNTAEVIVYIDVITR